MTKPIIYRECRLIQDGHTATAWIREDRAGLYASIAIPEVSGIWLIVNVGQAKSSEALRARVTDEGRVPRPRIQLGQRRDPFADEQAPSPAPIGSPDRGVELVQ